MRIYRRALLLPLAVFLAAACSVLGDDSGRIELPVGGALEITPSCVALPLPTSSSTDLTAVSVPVTIFARDRDQRPAESLSVSVFIGECPSAPSAADGATGVTTGAAGEAGEGESDSSQAVNGSSGEAASCGSQGPVAEERWGAISLAATLGDSSCATDGPQRLSCSLGPDGTAAFQVFRNSTAADLAEKTIPLCFQSPAVYGIYSKSANVVLSPNAPVAAGGLLVSPEGQISPAAAVTCDSLDCQRGASLQLTLLSSSGVSSPTGANDGGAGAPSTDVDPVVTQSTLHALLDVEVNGAASVAGQDVRIVLGNDCSGAIINQVEIPVDSLSSQVFSICTGGAGGTFKVIAVLLEDQQVSGSGLVTIPPALRRVTAAAGADGTLVTVSMCGGDPVSGVTVAGGVSQGDGTFLLGGATPSAIDAGVPDAGSGGEAGASNGVSPAGGNGGGTGAPAGGASTPSGTVSVTFAQGATSQVCGEVLP